MIIPSIILGQSCGPSCWWTADIRTGRYLGIQQQQQKSFLLKWMAKIPIIKWEISRQKNLSSGTFKKQLLAMDFDHTICDTNTDVEVQDLAKDGHIPHEIKSLFSTQC